MGNVDSCKYKDSNKMTESNHNNAFDYYLDITTDVCPMTFVRTKLLIERMKPGQTVEVRLQGSEPLINVPRSVRELGHEVVSLEAEDSSAPEESVHRLVIKKN